jgi:hypothetical protein
MASADLSRRVSREMRARYARPRRSLSEPRRIVGGDGAQALQAHRRALQAHRLGRPVRLPPRAGGGHRRHRAGDPLPVARRWRGRGRATAARRLRAGGSPGRSRVRGRVRRPNRGGGGRRRLEGRRLATRTPPPAALGQAHVARAHRHGRSAGYARWRGDARRGPRLSPDDPSCRSGRVDRRRSPARSAFAWRPRSGLRATGALAQLW